MGGAVTPQAKPVEGATLDWKATEHAFGEVPQNVPAEVTFTFVNNTGAEVLITDVKTSCGCTTPGWTREPIAPGATGEVKASYNAKKPGVFNKTVTVFTNNTSAPTKLKLSGTVIEDTKEN